MNDFRTGWLEQWRMRAGERWWWPLAAVAVLGVGIAIWALTRSSAPEPLAAAPADPASAVEAPEAPAEGDGESAGATPPPTAAPPAAAPSAAAAVDAGPALSPTVEITFRVFPPRPATVTWGSKRLGVIDRNKPLVVERPRDSGPLDVIIRSTGFIPVHTRAYTFDDSTIDVKITPIEKKGTIYGYKEPILDAGVPFPVTAPDLR